MRLVRQQLGHGFCENKALLFVSSVGFTTALIIAFFFGASISELGFIPASIASSLAYILIMFSLAYISLYPLILVRNVKKGKIFSGTNEQINKIINNYIDSGRLGESPPVFLAILLVLMTIPVMKSLILYIHPYTLDPLFAQWDMAIHGGMYPQYFLAPLVEKLHMVSLINFSYNFWLGVMFGGYWYAVFIDTDKYRRNVFLWASVIAWLIMGWGLATALSSVGPIFFGEFYPDLHNPYLDYMAHLQSIHDSGTRIVSLWVADLLVSMARDSSVTDLNGMSAMPSMHVAVSFLLALYLWRVNRIWGILAILFAFLILMGSVYLAWHYAIDGYISIIGVCVIWWICAAFLKQRSS